MRKKLTNLARVVLLAISGLAALTALIFVKRPDWVDAFDARTVAAHTAATEAALLRVERAPPGQEIAQMQALLAELTDVRKGDRLAPGKRAAFVRLHGAQLANQAAGAALTTAHAWQAFDALDLVAKLATHDALLALPGRHIEAATVARELFAVAPDQQRFFLPHLQACLAAHDHAGAAQAFFAYLGVGGTPVGSDIETGWVLQRDAGDGFDPLSTEVLDARCGGDDLAVTFSPPPGSRRLRLTFPARAALTLTHVRFEVTTQSGTFEVNLRDLAHRTADPVSSRGLRLDGDRIGLDGDDQASLLWGMGPGSAATSTWTLRARCVREKPLWLDDVLGLEAVGVAGRALLASSAPGDAGARLRYLAARRAALLCSVVSVQMDDGPATTVPITANGSDAAQFRVTFARAEHAAVRLVMPAIACVDLQLRTPFSVESRLQPKSRMRLSEGVLRAAAPSADAIFELQPSDPSSIELIGELR